MLKTEMRECLNKLNGLLLPPGGCLRYITSIPSLLMANSSKVRIALLMTCIAGKTVMPMLMALLLLGSSTKIAAFLVSAPFCSKRIKPFIAWTGHKKL